MVVVMNMKMKKREQENLEANFRKIWLMERVHCPFMCALRRVQKKWGDLPVKTSSEDVINSTKAYLDKLTGEKDEKFFSEEFEKFAPVINQIEALHLPKERAKKAVSEIVDKERPFNSFIDSIKEIMERFEFEEWWFPSLVIYVVTGKICPPYEQQSRNVPSKSLAQDWQIFLLTMEKDVQRGFLKRLFELPRRAVAVLGSEDTKWVLREPLIHDYTEIADKVWGEPDLDDKGLSTIDRKRINRVKTRIRRFRKFIVPCTDEDLRGL